MRTLEIRNSAVSLSAYFPSRKDIESLKLGDLAPNAFGKLARVVAITNRREDVSGKLFACYTVEGGERSTITNLMKENEVIGTIDLHSYFKSVEIDTAQRLALSVVRTNEAHWSPQVVTLNS